MDEERELTGTFTLHSDGSLYLFFDNFRGERQTVSFDALTEAALEISESIEEALN